MLISDPDRIRIWPKVSAPYGSGSGHHPPPHPHLNPQMASGFQMPPPPLTLCVVVHVRYA
jgi:hypothetical protein